MWYAAKRQEQFAQPVFQPPRLKGGVGFYPRVNFDGERKVSPRARSPPFLRTTALLLLRLGRSPSRACWELLQVPYEHSPRTCTAGTVALTPARCLLTEANTTLLDSTVAQRKLSSSSSSAMILPVCGSNDDGLIYPVVISRSEQGKVTCD